MVVTFFTSHPSFSIITDTIALYGLSSPSMSFVCLSSFSISSFALEANAAMRSIVRRDTGEGYEEYLIGLAKASGIKTPAREDLVKLDRKRKKKASNDDWKHPHDPDANITKMKDGRMHLAHKAEHAVDMDTGAVVAVTVQPADGGDTTSIGETLSEVLENLSEVAEGGDDGAGTPRVYSGLAARVRTAIRALFSRRIGVTCRAFSTIVHPETKIWIASRFTTNRLAA